MDQQTAQNLKYGNVIEQPNLFDPSKPGRRLMVLATIRDVQGRAQFLGVVECLGVAENDLASYSLVSNASLETTLSGRTIPGE